MFNELNDLSCDQRIVVARVNGALFRLDFVYQIALTSVINISKELF